MEHEKLLSITNSHVNLGYQHELVNNDLLDFEADNSESADSNYGDQSTPSSSDCASEPEWNENVGMKGDLFYVESKVDSTTEKKKVDKFSLQSEFHSLSKEQGASFNNSRNQTPQKSKTSLNENNKKEPVKEINKVEIVQVNLNISKSHQNPSKSLVACEAILGIICQEGLTNDAASSLNKNKRSKVIVKGFTPFGPAIKSELIRIGDIIFKVDGRDIFWDNISHELSKLLIPKKVKLHLERRIYSPTDNVLSTKPKDKTFILKLVKSGLEQVDLQESIDSFVNGPYAILYLRNAPNASTSPNDDVAYEYPQPNPFSSLSGMFITIAHLIPEIVNSSLRSSSLIINNKIVRINYCQEESDLLLLALPQESVSNETAEALITNITRLIKWQFYSLARAFTDKENRKTLDHFFKLFFYSSLSKDIFQNTVKYTFFECLGGIPQFVLGSELQEKMDNLLSELESGDFGDISEAFFDTKRLYLILGSALFYKGILCVNHLPKEDLMDIYLYSQYFQLFALTTDNKVSQIIIWREVFPARRQKISKNNDSNLDFPEEHGRWFILMVALNHSLLCVLLQVGGCTARASNHPPPDPFYVDQVRNVLLQMNESDIVCQIEKTEIQTLPELANPDLVLMKMKESHSKLRPFLRHQPQLNQTRNSSNQIMRRKETLGKYSISHSSLLSSSGKKFHEVGGTPKKLTSYHADLEKQSLLAQNSPPEDFEHDRSRSPHSNESFSVLFKNGILHQASSSCSDAESRTSSEDIYRGLKSRRILSGSFDLSSLRTDLEDIESETGIESAKFLTGNQINLFHYVHLNLSDGVLIWPNDSIQDDLLSPHASSLLQSQVLSSFQNSVSNMHKVFQTMLKNKDITRNRESSQFTDHTIPPIKEQGVLFQVSPPDSANANTQIKKSSSTLAFWVIGRMFTSPEVKEIYVCFQDSTSQNLVELAFRLSFGNQC